MSKAEEAAATKYPYALATMDCVYQFGENEWQKENREHFLEGVKWAVSQSEKELDHFIQAAWSDRAKKDTELWRQVCSSVAMNFGRCKDRIKALIE